MLFAISCTVKSEKILKHRGQTIYFHTYKRKIKGNDTIIYGNLIKNTVINSVPCKKGWIRLKNGELSLFSVSESIEFENIVVPSGSWVINNCENTSIVYPCNRIICDFPVKGGGGQKGTRTVFDKSGKLKMFFPSTGFEHEGRIYKKSLRKPVKISPNGKLSQ